MYVVPPAGGSHLAAKGILVNLLRETLTQSSSERATLSNCTSKSRCVRVRMS